MEIQATEKAVAQLQKIFDFLGDYGGQIETNTPESWWTLNVEVDSVGEPTKSVQIGIYQLRNGDVVFDPLFHLVLSMEENKIKSATIIACDLLFFSGNSYIDRNDIFHAPGVKEKDPWGLCKRFSSFMNNMAEVGPYLTDPKKVTKYTKSLSD